MWVKTIIVLAVFQISCFGQTKEQKEVYDHAILLYEQGDYDSSNILLKRLNDRITVKEPQFKLRITNNLGNIQADLGKNTAALKYYQSALKISRKFYFKVEEAEILKNIGALFVSWKNFKKAKYYYNESLKKAEELDAKKLIADCFNNLGTVYEQEGNLAKAKKYYFAALDFYTKVNEKPSVGMSYSNLAIVYKTQDLGDSSLYFNHQALKIAEESNDLWMVAAILNNIGNFYGERSDYKRAQKYLNRSLSVARKIDAIEIEVMSLESLSDAAEKVNDYRLAYEYLKEMKSKEIEFNSIEQKRNLDELEIKYQTKEKELENQSLLFENEKKSKNAKIYVFIFVVILLMVLLIGFLVFKQKKNRMEEQRRTDVSNALISSDSEARISIARDLHDSVGQQLAILKMYTSQFNNESSDKMIDQLTNDVRKISHKLVPEAFSFGLINALKELKEQIGASDQMDVELNLAETGIENFNQTQQLAIFRILQELISNVIRHSQATKMTIDVKDEKHELILTLSDNGKGFESEKVKNSTGLGWKNIEARVLMLKGRDTLESSVGRGTLYKLIIPYA